MTETEFRIRDTGLDKQTIKEMNEAFAEMETIKVTSISKCDPATGEIIEIELK